MPATSSSFVAFCPQKAENANRPGSSAINTVSLMAVRPGHLGKDEKDPNAALFADDNDGGISITLSGLATAEAAKYRGGKKYQVTITELE